jgi:hypothetical protein
MQCCVLFRNVTFNEEDLPVSDQEGTMDMDDSWHPSHSDVDDDSLYQEIIEEIMQDADITIV